MTKKEERQCKSLGTPGEIRGDERKRCGVLLSTFVGNEGNARIRSGRKGTKMRGLH